MDNAACCGCFGGPGRSNAAKKKAQKAKDLKKQGITDTAIISSDESLAPTRIESKSKKGIRKGSAA